MSLLNYFKRKTPEERGIFLPTPVTTESISEEEVAACNKEVETAIVKNERQTKQYCSYSAKERASIGRYAVTIEAVKINMCMSVIKPTSANWILFAYDCIRFVPNVVCNGFCKAGIVDALKDV